MKRRRNIFRDGRVHVSSRLCDTCIYRPDTDLADARERLTKQALKADSVIVCHSTLEKDEATCRGFYEKHRCDVCTLRLAQALDVVQFVDPQADTA